MKPVEFVLWLKGLIAGAPKYQPNPEQWKVIKDVVEQVELDSNKLNQNTTSGTYPKESIISYSNKQQLND